MMTNLTAANNARLNSALDKRYSFSFGVFTFRQAIEAGYFSHAEKGEAPSVKWDRRKFNRMDHKQQAEYQRKLDTMKTEYRFFNAGCEHESYIIVPKLVFDWYSNKKINSEGIKQ